MSKETLIREVMTRSISPFRIDLVLARTAMAVLKLQVGKKPLQEELESVDFLRKYYVANRVLDSRNGSITSAVVPNQPMREAIERTLSKIPIQVQTKAIPDQGELEILEPILEKVVNCEKLGKKEAADFLLILWGLQKSNKPQERKELPDVSSVL